MSTTPATGSVLGGMEAVIASGMRLQMLINAEYKDIPGLNKITPSLTKDIAKEKTYATGGTPGLAIATGSEETIAFEGLEVKNDATFAAFAAKFRAIGKDSQGQFNVIYANGDNMEFLAAVEGQMSQNEGPSSLSKYTGTLHIYGTPLYVEAGTDTDTGDETEEG